MFETPDTSDCNVTASGLRHGGRTALLAAVAPVALYAAPAVASPNCQTYACADGTVTLDGDHYDYTYTFTSNSLTGVDRIEIPEIRAGVFTSSDGTYAGTVPNGWVITEQGSSEFGFYYPYPQSQELTPPFNTTSANPGAYLEITGIDKSPLWSANNGGEIFTLTLESPYGTTAGTNFFVNPLGFIGAEGFPTLGASLDPPTPDPVPEPATLGLLSAAMAGLAGIRRRRRA